LFLIVSHFFAPNPDIPWARYFCLGALFLHTVGRAFIFFDCVFGFSIVVFSVDFGEHSPFEDSIAIESSQTQIQHATKSI